MICKNGQILMLFVNRVVARGTMYEHYSSLSVCRDANTAKFEIITEPGAFCGLYGVFLEMVEA